MNTTVQHSTRPLAANPQYVADADSSIAALHGPASGIAVHDPSTGEKIAFVPDSTPEEALAAVGRAQTTGVAWAEQSARHRASILHRWYELLIDHGDQLAKLISREMGKPLAEARGEVKYGTDFVRWYAEEAVRPGGNFQPAPDGGADILTRRAPVGLAVLITPWNFPLAMATRKIAPALAAGCPVVIKPATATPLTTYYAVKLAVEAGVPEDLIQVVSTSGSAAFSQAVLADPRVRKISFTGSTPVGRTLLELASKNVLRSSMELGGNAPLLVFNDADFERAIEGTIAAKLRNGGQSCIGANRIYVQSGIADEFAAELARRFAEVEVGAGLSDSAQLGPLIDQRAVDQMQELVQDALNGGAHLLVGGHGYSEAGHFYAPTVLDHVAPLARVSREEIFGPIAAIRRFDSEQQVLDWANDTEFGLAGYVFTQDVDRALNVADRLQTGIVGINQGVPSNAAAPFGGVKQSGLGREGASEGLEEYQSIRFYNISRRSTR
ncbi:NAD-dependent succinate-semialdehyde dehydrogenase [Glutamicibacter sp.]|uniref:NAD-dependent succinate-semialdehyde dehydrogenase n=1 Tax=Glutamicibacter sp. TaxID=1931995 RepID=UPI0028BEF7FA|nr:NAD-dependent succinate-semialdehyde dehydrogenase [Glutamicibacter sp.]